MRPRIQRISQRTALPCVGAVAVAAVLLNACAGLDSTPQGKTTTIYVLRHAEPDFKDPDRPLTDKGRARAEKLVAHFARIPITHVYSTHTDRTRDTVAPLARARGLAIKQFPPIGRELDGKIVGNRTSGAAAIKPLIAALKALPASSTAVVAANSENLYPVLAGIGAPVNPACTAERSDCLPCATRKCFDETKFNNVWKLTLGRDGQATLSRTTYGD